LRPKDTAVGLRQCLIQGAKTAQMGAMNCGSITLSSL